MKQIQQRLKLSHKKALIMALVSALLIQPFVPAIAFAGGSAPDQAPSAPSISGPTSGSSNTSYTFTAVSTDPENDQIDYGFDWDNDGIIDGYTGYVNSGTPAQLSHTWTADGTYTFSVYAQDPSGQISSVSQATIDIATASTTSSTGNTGGSTNATSTNTSNGNVNVAPNTPVVLGPSTGTLNTTQTFSVSAVDPEGDNVAYGFDWNNDGIVDDWTPFVASGISATDSHIWSTAGDYTFSVYAKDSFGAISSAAQVSVSISTSSSSTGNGPSSGSAQADQAPSSPSVTVSGNSAGSPVTFTAVSTDPENDQIDYGFDWDNDGIIDGYTGYVNSGTPAQLSHTWTYAGSYTVSVTAKDAWGQISSASMVTVNVSSSSPSTPTNTAPNTPVVLGPSTGTVGTVYTFSVSATDPQGDDVTYGADWDGTGNVSSWTPATPSGISATLSNSWSTPGTYQVKVYAKDVLGNISFPAIYPVTISSSGNNNGGGNNNNGGGNNNNGGNTGGTSTGGSSGSGSMGTGGGGGGYTGPCIGFGCPASTTPVPSSSGQSTGTNPNDVTIYFPTSSTGESVGSYRPSAPALVCPSVNFITEFLKIGASNDPNEVRKLQYFLNVYEGNNLPIDGVFGTSTEAAVATFQLKYASDILAPWGISTPTGIVYITTSRKINEIYCGDHPNYQGNQDLKDILQNNVLNSPSQYNPSQFNNAIGYGTTSSSSLANIAGVLGGLSQKVLDALKQIPIYPLLILILLLLGAGFTIQGTSIKDIGSNKSYTAFMRGIALVTVGSVLNVLNTLSFMLNPAWLSNNVGLDLRWVLGLDMANAIVVIAIAVSGLIALYTRSTQSSKDVAGGPHTPLAK